MRWRLYRVLMRLAHRFNWHYAPPIYPEGDTQLWCKWCGLRQTIKRAACRDSEKTISAPAKVAAPTVLKKGIPSWL